jgi:hypothetical protein
LSGKRDMVTDTTLSAEGFAICLSYLFYEKGESCTVKEREPNQSGFHRRTGTKNADVFRAILAPSFRAKHREKSGA